LKQATCAPDPALDGQLVYATCNITNMTHLGRTIDGLMWKGADEMTGLTLRSTVEVYAWIEAVSKSLLQTRCRAHSKKPTLVCTHLL